MDPSRRHVLLMTTKGQSNNTGGRRMVGLALALALMLAVVIATLVTGRLFILGFLGLVAVVTLPFRAR
jgi:uncharacterized membrane protein